jgi:lysophospholipase L1-like esterase
VIAGFALIAAVFATSTSRPHFVDRYPDAAIRIVAFGDSITAGERDGVTRDQTFVSDVETELRAGGLDVGIRNAGIVMQSTDDAMTRYQRDVIGAKPRVVMIMFGSNDSFIEGGMTKERVSLDRYRRNLESMIERAKAAGIRPILMTPPRWGLRPLNGLGENPNPRLEPYVQACRDIAADQAVPLVDHYADWKAAEENGQPIAGLTTDGLHPNPTGHARMAALLLPVLRSELDAAGKP